MTRKSQNKVQTVSNNCFSSASSATSVAIPTISPDDASLLALLQNAMPLVRDIFGQIASELAMPREKLLAKIDEFKKNGVIRQISGIFDAAAFGYRQVLVAFHVSPEKLDNAGKLIAEHPGVSHCYARTGEYNLWFTLAVSPQSRIGLEKTVEILAGKCETIAFMLLPTIKRYKLDVRFGDGPAPLRTASVNERSADRSLTVTVQQTQAVRALQQDLPLCGEDPFKQLAFQFDLDADMLLVHAADLLAAGLMRRYSAVLNHRMAGANSNVLVAWKANEQLADLAVENICRIRQVSHCYLRPAQSDWPYNLYTMIHGQSREDCQNTTQSIAQISGLCERSELWTEKEYKKQRVKFFDEAESQWEPDF